MNLLFTAKKNIIDNKKKFSKFIFFLEFHSKNICLVYELLLNTPLMLMSRYYHQLVCQTSMSRDGQRFCEKICQLIS
jgi:hypothetical protein